jgi:spore maturation protein CgeB
MAARRHGATAVTNGPNGSTPIWIGIEIGTISDLTDLRAKIYRYLADPKAREAIALAGHARAARDHTYRFRLQSLRDVVAGRSAGYPEPAACR